MQAFIIGDASNCGVHVCDKGRFCFGEYVINLFYKKAKS